MRIVPDARSGTLMPIPKEKIKPDSIVYTDAFVSYNVLDVYKFRHYRINLNALFADGKSHINGIENFRNQAKRYLRKFNGTPRARFHL
jgi:transposase